ncbi:prephenate dehydratase [Sphingobacterium paludis]|uniref:prephenate dehydratase n=1 Tax=Sphingobacterium paludis TaxID=1476465 RepID=A0A4R7CYK4_9SPHI|nr:prephenate dehydratase [Sphingobacterium paludis]TDS12214.1 prephenate dehydratase [Sphingobacterium paludis]
MKTRIAIQGVKASFHEEAAYKYFGEEIETIECESFKKTCEMLKQGKADYVVMAIENSIAGSILPNYNLLRDYRFHIIGEVHLNIQQNLLVLPGVKLTDIKFVESHPIAIRQCDEFLSDFTDWTVKEGMDTAACAKNIADNKLKNTAAIASTMAAKLYGLEILEKRIETNKKNATRFLILANEVVEQKNANKASLSFQTGNAVGALANVLQCFAEQNVNLSKIQSMPVVGKRNEYDFYVDVEWKKQSDYDAAIRKVLKHTVNFNIMGEYIKNEKV